MIRRSEHTFTTFAATAGRIDTRQSFAWNAVMCVGLGGLNYQPKSSGTTPTQQLD
ncbi:MAG: hypothetical protein QM785_09975 [Pyrinomonadaceae bacterium]